MKETKRSAAASLLSASRDNAKARSALTETMRDLMAGQGQDQTLRALVGSLANPSHQSLLHQKSDAHDMPLVSVAGLGKLVRGARKQMKMSQTDFAAHAGVGRRLVSELERGKGSLEFEKVLACATAAGIDLFAKARNS